MVSQMQSDESNYESMEYNICLSSETARLISEANLIEMKFFDVKSFEVYMVDVSFHDSVWSDEGS
jgi:hypothetical protein